MKKEYIVLGLIIVALSAYLVMHKENRDNYVLPELPKVNVADVTTISLEKNGHNITLSRDGDKWFVTDKKYPADQGGVTKMLDIIKSLELSALVSESGNLAPYELDEKNRVIVTAGSKSGVLRKFDIGKAAPTFRHTFVKLDGNSNVYHAEKSFRRDFDKSVDDLRDKSTLPFDKSKITAVTLEKEDAKETFAFKDGKISKDAETAAAGTGADAVKAENSSSETPSSKGTAAKEGEDKTKESVKTAPLSEKEKAVESLFSMLTDFRCHSFTDSDTKDNLLSMKSAAEIVMKGDKEITLTLYPKDSKQNYPAISSESPYPFLLDTYQGDQLLSEMDKALGIKKEKAPENGKESAAGTGKMIPGIPTEEPAQDKQ